MKSKILFLASIPIFVLAAPMLFAQGDGFSFQVGMGFQGSFSYYEAGINTPVLGVTVYSSV